MADPVASEAEVAAEEEAVAEVASVAEDVAEVPDQTMVEVKLSDLERRRSLRRVPGDHTQWCIRWA